MFLILNLAKSFLSRNTKSLIYKGKNDKITSSKSKTSVLWKILRGCKDKSQIKEIFSSYLIKSLYSECKEYIKKSQNSMTRDQMTNQKMV